MRLIYYCWSTDGITGSFPHIFDKKPDDVRVNEETGHWQFVTDNPNDPGYNKQFEIGGGYKRCREVTNPFARMTTGCITVIDQDNFTHIENLEDLAFHYGTLLIKLHRPIR